ncbi:hypothetical protein SAMN02745150_00993 [Brevinema andersonii]|uniref:Dolichyl-phosphate-mannose-protein mannosyltransferase n=1 Tax=Brevinema andersonii TaxID=34097 RepID=A0A1I1E963_BREAD|nr:hypothetical protein [Brevinema andersonii]SFB83142.1 hypothetical protein SAMN02745150_00993 [Brevinema andersonii]
MNRFFILISPIVMTLTFFFKEQFPYYMNWDSTFLFTIDSLLINSRMMPEHLFHPNAFPLFFEYWIIFPFVKLFKLLNITTMSELLFSLNPYPGLAEMAWFLLILRISYIFIGFGFLYMFFCKLFKDDIKETSLQYRIVLSLFICYAVFSGYSNIAYTITTIRYESMGFMLWAAAMFVSLYAAETQKKRFILATGFLSGAAFITKLIFLPGVVLVAFTYYLHSKSLKQSFNISSKEANQSIIFSILYFIFVLVTLLLLFFMTVTNKILPSAFMQTLSSKHMGILYAIFPIFLSFQIILAFISRKYLDEFPSFAYYVNRLILFSIIFFVPMLLLLSLGKGIHIFLTTYIFSYGFGQISMSLETGHASPNNRIKDIGLYLTAGYFIMCCILSFLKVYPGQKNPKVYKISENMLLLFGMLLMSRLLLRIPGDFSTFFIGTAFLVVFKNIKKYIPYTKKSVFLVSMGFFCIIGSYYLNKKYPFSALNDLYVGSNYNYRNTEWKSYSYGFLGFSYQDKITRTYLSDIAWKQIFYWSRNPGQLTRLIHDSLPSKPKISDTALIQENGVLSYHNEKLTTHSPELSGALVYEISEENFTVLARSDYTFYLAFSEEQTLSASNPEIPRIEPVSLTFITDQSKYHLYKMIPSNNPGGPFSLSLKKNGTKAYLIIKDEMMATI